jgi:hypothetical protein
MYRFAADCSNGTSEMLVVPGQSAIASFHATDHVRLHRSVTRVEVATLSLDTCLAHVDDRVTFMKLDAEGNEFRILQGSRSVLTKHRPRMLLEYNPHAYRRAGWQVDDVVQLLETVGGYTVRFLGEDGSTRAVCSGVPHATRVDLYCIPDER